MAPTAIGNLQPNNVHTSTFLTGMAVRFQYPDLVGLKFAPLTPVGKNADEYPIFYGDDESRLVDTERGPGGAYNQVTFGVSKDSYHCNGHGLENAEPWETMANADPTWQEYLSGAAVARRLKRLVMIQHEYRVASLFTTTTNYASGFYEQLATNQFNDSGVDGLERLLTEVDRIRTRTGGAGIKLGMTSDVWINMQRDSNFQPTLSSRLLTDKAALAAALEIDEVFSIGAQYNTADKGQTASRSNLWGSNRLWLFTSAPMGADAGTPTTARTFSWNNAQLGTQGGEVVRVINDERFQNRYVQYGRFYDVKATGVDASDDFVSAVYLDAVYQ